MMKLVGKTICQGFHMIQYQIAFQCKLIKDRKRVFYMWINEGFQVSFCCKWIGSEHFFTFFGVSNLLKINLNCLKIQSIIVYQQCKIFLRWIMSPHALFSSKLAQGPHRAPHRRVYPALILRFSYKSLFLKESKLIILVFKNLKSNLRSSKALGIASF